MVAQQEERISGRTGKPLGEAYSERLLVKLTPSQMAVVRKLVARDAYGATSAYVRRMLMERAAQVLGPQNEG